MKKAQTVNKPGRSWYVYTVVTFAQREKIRRAAAAAGLTVSGWSRRQLVHAATPGAVMFYDGLMRALGIPEPDPGAAEGSGDLLEGAASLQRP